MANNSLRILLLGGVERSEFREARSRLETMGEVGFFSSIEAAVCALEEGRVVADLIVLAQAYPGEFSHESVDRLRRSSPLTRVVGLMGSWCEGEMRTGSPWPAVVRNYWHQWPVRCERQLGRLARGACGSWSLPTTATEEERLLTDADGNREEKTPEQSGVVLIQAENRETAQWISATCRSRGFTTVRQRSTGSVDAEGIHAAVFDGTDLNEKEYENLARLVKSVNPSPVIAMLSFPRIEDQRRAYAAGATAVVSKPADVEDFLWELEEGRRV